MDTAKRDALERELVANANTSGVFMISMDDIRAQAVGFGLLANHMIEVTGEHIPDDAPETFWLVRLTDEGRAWLAASA